MRSNKGTRRIVVGGTEYCWRSRGDDGYIVVGISPANGVGPYIRSNFGYHETAIDPKKGGIRVRCGQLVVTGRLVRRIIEHAVAHYGYDPNSRGEMLTLRRLDDLIEWQDAVRAPDHCP